MIVLLYSPNPTVGMADTELRNLNAMEIIGYQLAGVKWWHGYHNGQHCQSSNQNSLSYRPMKLASHAIPRSERNKKPSKVLLHLYKQKSSRSSGKSLN